MDMPIIPVMIFDEKMAIRMAQICFEKGLFIIPVAYPVVEKGKERLRATLTAGHTQEDIDTAVEIIVHAAKEVGMKLAMPRHKRPLRRVA